MYEFQYHPSFSSDMKPKTVIGDHGDELFSVFGAPFLKGNGSLLSVSLELGDLGSSLGVGASVSFSSPCLSFLILYNRVEHHWVVPGLPPTLTHVRWDVYSCDLCTDTQNPGLCH